MIKEYLLIEDTLYPMLPDSSEEAGFHDSKMWNVYKGDEMIGIISGYTFQPVSVQYMKYEGMQVYHFDKEIEDGEASDLYALALHDEVVKKYDSSQDVTENILTETMHIQEAMPDERIINATVAHQAVIEEKQTQANILYEATEQPALIDTLRDTYESVHNITFVFGKTIAEAIEFLKEEGEVVGDDAVIGIHEDYGQRCIVMHESEEHRTERLRVEDELREAAMSKLTIEEKRALGIGRK